ncbi:hypothetical protein [Rouxiella badensis]|uniref:hypothetical protein n=1 Tax=Rouxiella badensis TaxID=1646377 RepID=UPI0017888A39|nr:hypothetical protein [Rouxiella badensis]QOI56571.1 hypothetical protein H2866_05395 [Rouxiella badensis subsp. acadiensis]
MRKVLAALIGLASLSAHAFQCGPFIVNPDHYRTTINGDLQNVVNVVFQDHTRSYNQATLTLLPKSLTDTDKQYRLIAAGGLTTLELLTREHPPRVLNRAVCNSNLSGFDW